MQVCVDPKIYSVLYPKNYALCSYHLRGARKYYYYFILMKTCKMIRADGVLVQTIAKGF